MPPYTHGDILSVTSPFFGTILNKRVMKPLSSNHGVLFNAKVEYVLLLATPILLMWKKKKKIMQITKKLFNKKKDI